MLIDVTNPVYQSETRRQISSRRLLALQRGCLPVLATVVTFSLTLVVVPLLLSRPFSFDNYIAQLLGTVFLVLVVVQVLAGIGIAILTIGQASPAISGEVEQQSWDLLRTTTLSLPQVIFGKFGAVAARLRTPLIAVLLLRLISGLTGLLFLTWNLLRNTIFYIRPGGLTEAFESWLWLPGLGVVLLGAVFYLTQPIVQFGINGSLGLLFSALTPSQARALAGGLAGRLVLWVVMGIVYGGAGRLLVFASDNLYGSNVAPYFLGLTPDQEALIMMVAGGLGLLLVFAWQAGLILFLLGWVHRRAGRIGGLT